MTGKFPGISRAPHYPRCDSPLGECMCQADSLNAYIESLERKIDRALFLLNERTTTPGARISVARQVLDAS